MHPQLYQDSEGGTFLSNTEIVRVAPDAPTEKIIAALNGLLDATLGNHGARMQFKGHDGTSTDPTTGAPVASGLYTLVVQNTGANHAQIRNAADNADVLTVTDTAFSVAPLASFNGGANATTVNATTVTATDLIATTSMSMAGRLQGKLSVSAICSAPLALGGAMADVPGCAVTLTVGDWAVCGVFDVSVVGAADIGMPIAGQLVTTGGAATIEPPLTTITISPAQPFRCTVERTWIVRVTAGTTVKMQANRTGGAGASIIDMNSSIAAINA